MKILALLLSFLICTSSSAQIPNLEKEKKYSISTPYSRISQNGFADIIEPLLPAVVNISTVQKDIKSSDSLESMLENLPNGSLFKNFKDLLEKQNSKKRELKSLGSGFIISKDGYVVTNYHVIDNASKIMVNLHDSESFEAKVIGSDKKTDIALLKINAKKDLAFVKMGNSNKSRIGEWVIAVGNPFGLGGSVSVGIISGHDRNINNDKFDDYIQTDAAINKGNSGGPLFNIKGEVIGIATAIFSPSGGNVGIGFATPSSNAKEVVEQLKVSGEIVRGWIGVSIQNVSEEIAKTIGMEKPKGAFVVEVVKDGPAKKAGILPTDIIVKFDGKEVKEMKDLPRIVAKTKVGKKAKVEIIREGKSKTLKVKVQKLDEEKAKEAFDQDSKIGKSEATDTILGMDLANLTKKVKEENKIKSNIRGILVVDFEDKAQAKKKGLQKGDIILSANQKPISSTKDFKKIINNLKESGKESVLLFVKREKIIKTDSFVQQQSYNFTVILPLK